MSKTTSKAKSKATPAPKVKIPPAGKLKLKPSPRLFVRPELADDLQSHLHSEYLQGMGKLLLRDADWLTRRDPLKEGEGPTYGTAARYVQSHLDCLTCAWMMTRKAKYREAAMKHLAGLMKWNHISCEARANTPAKTELPFCLSYGEQATAIGLMYDHFRPDLTSKEQKIFFNVIDRFHLKEAVKCLTNPPWWANKAWSNWNGVCCGGMGMMALAFYEDRKETHKLVPFVEKSLAEYFSSYITNGGGNHEGTGYWNYGMNYSMRYLISWEHATGKKHPAFGIKEIAKSLHFPIDFTRITFGDNDGWQPSMFFFMLCKRLKQPNAAYRAAAYLPDAVDVKGKRRQEYAQNGDLIYAAPFVPTTEEMQKTRKAHAKKPVPVARKYDGMDWAVLADDEAFPTLRMAIRGGSAKVMGHGMTDLLSFRCRVNGELFITDQMDSGYLVPTFGKRGGDLYARSAASKSTLFVEGLGCAKDAECNKTEIVSAPGISGVRIDASSIYLPRMPSRFIGRLFLFVDNACWLVIDHVLSNNNAVDLGIESRFHTLADYSVSKDHVSLRSGKERMQMTFAALQPGVMQLSRGMPSLPRVEQTTIFRWLGKERVPDNLHVVALVPGSKKAGLKLSVLKDGNYQIEVARPGAKTRRIKLSPELRLR